MYKSGLKKITGCSDVISC